MYIFYFVSATMTVINDAFTKTKKNTGSVMLGDIFLLWIVREALLQISKVILTDAMYPLMKRFYPDGNCLVQDDPAHPPRCTRGHDDLSCK